MFYSPLRLCVSRIAIALLLVVTAVTSSTQAAVISYQTPVGATSNGLGVSAWVEFTTAAGQITVTLHNMTVDPKAVGQSLSGLTFTISSGQNAGTLASSIGLERTVSKGGAYTDGGSVATGWVLNTVGTQLQLTVLGTPESPKHTILGLPDATTGLYDSANSSITGGSHNPFLGQSATFVLDIPGVTANSSISAVTLSFNTAAGYDVTLVPEPLTLGALAIGGVMMVLRRRRKQ
jgi:hypothetical protein